MKDKFGVEIKIGAMLNTGVHLEDVFVNSICEDGDGSIEIETQDGTQAKILNKNVIVVSHINMKQKFIK